MSSTNSFHLHDSSCKNEEYNKWPPFSDSPYDWTVPTNLVYQQATSLNAKDSPLQFTAPYQRARSKLDYSVHKNPALRRQTFQDAILSRILEQVQESILDEPSIVFTIGPLGAGTSYVLSELYQRDLFPIENFTHIDIEKIKQELPEMAGYYAANSSTNNMRTTAHHQVNDEAGQITDVLFEHSL